MRRGPFKGDLVKLAVGLESYTGVEQFLESHPHDNYSLSIYDILSSATMEVICSLNDVSRVIMYVSSVEHCFPEWIGEDTVSKSYVVVMRLARGHIQTPSFYSFYDGKLHRIM